MATILLSVALMGFLMAIMAIGVIGGRPELKGSCGGVGGAGCHCAPGEREACTARASADETAGDDPARGPGKTLPVVH